MWQKEFSDLLRTQFAAKKRKNPRVSVRSFAKQLGLSAGAVSELLSGKRNWSLSSTRALKVLEKLPLGAVARGRMLMKMGLDPKLPRDEETLSPEACQFLLDWRYQGVLFSLDLPAPFSLPNQLGRRFGIKEEEVSKILRDLAKLGLVKKDRAGAWRCKEGFWFNPPGISKKILLDHQLAQLALANSALRMLPTEDRDFTSMTFIGTRERLPQIREEIRGFYEKLSLLMDADQKNTDVFRVSVNLFPLVKELKAVVE